MRILFTKGWRCVVHCFRKLGQKRVDNPKRKALRIPTESVSAIIQARRKMQHKCTTKHIHTRARARTYAVTHRFPIEIHLNRLTRVGGTGMC